MALDSTPTTGPMIGVHQEGLASALEAAGLTTDLRIHDMRHTCAALMIAAGAHPEHIKRHLGHSLITVTMDLYGHLFPSDEDAIAERLNEMLRESQTESQTDKATGSGTQRY